MIGWERIERDWLFAFLSDTARPWPKHAVLAWLRYANGARNRGVQIQTPTREGGWTLQGSILSGRDLAEAVGLTYKVTRSLMESDAWADFSDEKGTDLAPARAQQGRNEGAERAQQGRNERAERSHVYGQGPHALLDLAIRAAWADGWRGGPHVEVDRLRRPHPDSSRCRWAPI